MHPPFLASTRQVAAGCGLVIASCLIASETASADGTFTNQRFPAVIEAARFGDLNTQDSGSNFMHLEAEAVTNGLALLVQPSWNQLMNGSLDGRAVEVRGIIESITTRKDGWLVVVMRTKDGVLKVILRRAGIRGATLEENANAIIRVRGILSVDRNPATQRVITGQIRFFDSLVIVDEPVPKDLFAIPLTSAVTLTRSDTNYNAFRLVRVAGQLIHVRSRVNFLMDGRDGLRFVTEKPLNLVPGDLVEVVGYPDILNAAAPVLQGAVARKTGHAPLPEPKSLTTAELIRPANDSTWVRVEGMLSGVKQVGPDLVLEMRAEQWRFWARLVSGKEPPPRLRVGSRLALTGAYCAQGEYKIFGQDVAALDILLNSSANIKVLSHPPWWTLEKLFVVVGFLATVLLLALLWITQLHRQVRLRTAELEVQIQERQRAEHLREMERERTRIAQDLHDELGSNITEISMLAARAKSTSAAEENRIRYLDEMGEKTHAVVTALDEIVWTMNPGHDSLASLVSYFNLYADRFLGLANVNWKLENSVVLPDRTVDSQCRHQLFLAFKEALNNVVRHSGATEVRLLIQMEDGELQLAVADNGRGLPAGDLSTQDMNGVANMRARIEKLGGRFEITSEPAGGTTVWFCVPVIGVA